MANAKLGILGQQSPAANTDTALYTPSSSTRRAAVSTLMITNNSASPVTVRVYARIAGAAASSTNVIIPDITLEAAGQAGCIMPITIGISLDGVVGDALSCRASATGVIFTVFGVEEDIGA